MKILYLIKSFAAKAGTERVMSDKMNWLSERGYEITLVTYEQGTHPFAFPLNSSIKHYDLDTRFFELAKYNIVKRLFRYSVLKRHFKKNLQSIMNVVKPDIFVSTTYSLPLFDVLLQIESSSKRIIESHVACCTVKKAENYRSSFLLHSIFKLYDKWMLDHIRRFDGLVTLTENDANEWAKYSNNVCTIPNPVTFIPEELAPVGDAHRIICVGRLHEQKGFDLLIEAFSLIADKCSEWSVDIYGDGDEKQTLNNLIVSHNLEGRVTINSSTGNIYREYLNSSFFVLSSRYEGFGLVLLEAMSCGLPCISFDCPYGPGDIIEDGCNGFLVDNGNVQKMADKILWMIQNRDSRIEMGKRAKRSIMCYERNEIMKKWISFFNC